MKKFISMVMAAAMVVSLVPATAFAASGTVVGTTKIVGAVEEQENFGKFIAQANASEVQIKVTDFDYEVTDGQVKQEIVVTLDDAKFAFGSNSSDPNYGKAFTDATDNIAAEAAEAVKWFSISKDRDNSEIGAVTAGKVAADKWAVEASEIEDDTVTFTLYIDAGIATTMLDDATISIDLPAIMDGHAAGDVATVSVDTDIDGADVDDLVFASVLDDGIKVTLKKVAEVAKEEIVALEKDLKVEKTAGTFVPAQTFKLTLNNGFEFAMADKNVATDPYRLVKTDDNEAYLFLNGAGAGRDSFTIAKNDIKIEAASADEGDVAVLTIKPVKVASSEIFGVSTGFDNVGFKADAVKVDAATVIAHTVVMSVDADEDVPVIYSGVNKANTGITDDSDHKSLEVTIEETFAGAWNLDKKWNLELPEGVYVVGVEGENLADTTVAAGFANLEAVFADAYKEGDHENFEFGKRVFAETVEGTGKKAELTFKLELVADPTFVGDVTLKLTGAAFEEDQEVVIATFAPIATVEAASNDLIIDYRNTEVPTEIVVKEAEAGLWKKGMETVLKVDYMDFEDDATFTVNEESDMEIEDTTGEYTIGSEKFYGLAFEVDSESDDEAAVVTISDISLYMNRSLAAGSYDLEVGYNTAFAAYENQTLFAPVSPDEDKVDDVCDYSSVVKEGFVNVVTAGRDADDASFTTKVVVPVGANEIVAGENVVALDVPAYINAAGYTMLPVRAVAVALGIHNNNVLWDQATKTVTILYGQRIITMSVGSKVINVNGSAIPASAAVEIVDGRTFLGLRDLATALGVVDITWDAATQTATLNGNK